jgi:choline dehydrogenase-like flavoprotein
MVSLETPEPSVVVEPAEGVDALVLGAGSAGCVVAARLAEAGARVILIEAGDYPRDPDIHDPLKWPRPYRRTDVLDKRRQLRMGVVVRAEGAPGKRG